MSTNFDRKVAKSIDSRTWVDRRFLDTDHNHITSFICVLVWCQTYGRVAHGVYFHVIVADLLHSHVQ